MIQVGNGDGRRLPESLLSDWGPRTPLVFTTFVLVATVIAGFAAPGAGLAILVLGVLTLVSMDFGGWSEGEAKRGQAGAASGWDDLAARALEHLALGPRAHAARPTAPSIVPTDVVPVQFASAVPPVGRLGPKPGPSRPQAKEVRSPMPMPTAAVRTTEAPRSPSRVRVGRPMPD